MIKLIKGQDAGGALILDVTGKNVQLACPDCDCAFTLLERDVILRIATDKPNKCPACMPPREEKKVNPRKLENLKKGIHRGESRPKARTESSRLCEQIMLAGVHPIEAARKTGMKPQSAWRIYYMWVHARLESERADRAEARVKELESILGINNANV